MDEFLAKVKDYYAKALAWLRGLNLKRLGNEIRTMNWIELGHDIRHWVQRNRNNLFITLGVIAAVIIGLAVYAGDKAKKNDEAANYLHNGINSFNRALQAKDITPEDRRNELSRALQVFQYVIQQFPGSPSYGDAVFYLGNGLYASGNYNEAVQQFQTYLRKFPRRYLSCYAVESIGTCYEQLGDLAKASEYYGKVRTLFPDSSIAGRTGLNLGRLAEVQGNLKGAVENYQAVMNAAPNSAWGRQARLRLGFLEDKFQYYSQQPGGVPRQAPAAIQQSPLSVPGMP